MDVAQFWELKFGHLLHDIKHMLKQRFSREFLTEASATVPGGFHPGSWTSC
jgi:hypothetical protein